MPIPILSFLAIVLVLLGLVLKLIGKGGVVLDVALSFAVILVLAGAA